VVLLKLAVNVAGEGDVNGVGFQDLCEWLGRIHAVGQGVGVPRPLEDPLMTADDHVLSRALGAGKLAVQPFPLLSRHPAPVGHLLGVGVAALRGHHDEPGIAKGEAVVRARRVGEALDEVLHGVVVGASARLVTRETRAKVMVARHAQDPWPQLGLKLRHQRVALIGAPVHQVAQEENVASIGEVVVHVLHEPHE